MDVPNLTRLVEHWKPEGNIFGVILIWRYDKTWVDVKAYEPESWDGTNYFFSDHDRGINTSVLNDEGREDEIDREVEGFVKWDGCCQFNSDVHLCGMDDVQKHCNLLLYIHMRAFELMDREQE